ncbi:MAG: hypothetical protein EU547_05575 [Promethearchaeota archaeon]|nr:MAG: hypothetical protein EU547_05575 [Candidatus Lokiarchaeota archaeon]
MWESQIRELMNKGEKTTALEEINSKLETDPTSKKALLLKAEIYIPQELTKAIKIYKKVITFYEEKEDLETQVNIVSYIGDLYRNLDKQGEAEQYYEKALSKFNLYEKPLNDDLREIIVSCLSNLIEITEMNKKYEKTIKYYKKIIEIHQNSGLMEGLIQDFIDLGNFYFKTQDYKKAYKNYTIALNVCLDIEDYYNEPTIHFNISNALTQMKNYELAAEEVKKCIDGIDRLEGEDEYTFIYQDAKEIIKIIVTNLFQQIEDLIKQRKFNRSKKILKKIEAIQRDQNNYQIRAEIYYFKSKIAFNSNDSRSAKENLQKSIEFLKRMKSYKDQEIYRRVKTLLEEMKKEERKK